ncbi:MAG: amidohydrolase family protein [Ignavibacteria bacterium]
MMFALKSKKVLTPHGIESATVIIEDGKINDIIEYHKIPDCQLTDYNDLIIMPALTDTHVHINEPGRTEWEGFETATKAAAAGGITMLVDMPLNSSPVTTNVAALNKKIDSAKDKIYVDVGFYGGLIPGNTAELAPLIKNGVLGFKSFMINSGLEEFPHVIEEDLRKGLEYLSSLEHFINVPHIDVPHINVPHSNVPHLDVPHSDMEDLDVEDLDVQHLNMPQINVPQINVPHIPLLVHSEIDCGYFKEIHYNECSFKSFLETRPREWENKAIKLLIDLCREFNYPVHIVHLSSSDAIDMIKAAKIEGLPLTVETCPHYLYFLSEEIRDDDTRFKCTPPIRENENRERLWEAVKDGTIDFIVSDHSPCSPELKSLNKGSFKEAWGGISSLQFGLPVVWTEARKRNLSVFDVSKLMSENTANFIGLGKQKGKIKKGYDADILVFDPDKKFIVEEKNIFHKHKITPYAGEELYGVVETTYLRGEKIYENGKIISRSMGKVVLRIN